MENVTSDSDKILSDKLALSRELSSLRPEVEHLRAQVEANQGLLTEKLALQRQLTTLQVELENEKRTAARTVAKQGKKMEQDEDLRNEMEEVRKELAKEKKDRAKAEAALSQAEKAVEKVQTDLESQQQATERLQAKVEKLSKKEGKTGRRDETHEAALDELRQELEQEKVARKQAEKASKNAGSRDAEIEQLREQLEQANRESQKKEKASKKGAQQDNSLAETVRKELEDEKRERKRQEKEYTKTLAELQGRNAVLDDKLSAFREKLRSTKDKLKEKEAELEKATERAQTAPPTKASAQAGGAKTAAKTARKRTAATAEPEANLGTPGDGFPAKKTKRGTSVSAVGDTSTFSLTPFLNRAANTTMIASPIVEEEEEEEEAAPQESTPTALSKKASKKIALPKPKALAPAASNKANAKPRKKASAPVLDMVTEEASEISHNTSKDDSENVPVVTVPLKDADDGPSTKTKPTVPKFKPRKSIMSFATFVEEPAAEKKKKKRKLGTGKGSFDIGDAEDDAAPPKPVGVGKGLFAARALGKSVLGKQGQRPISGGFNMLSEEAFTFSPLKKDRRNGASFLK
ncbi:hypothetical protein J1614_011331 [Plenodomus biglobosus]|nr:hypothetical protein J1614_011331 [Plenodomus biglobosus]